MAWLRAASRLPRLGLTLAVGAALVLGGPLQPGTAASGSAAADAVASDARAVGSGGTGTTEEGGCPPTGSVVSGQWTGGPAKPRPVLGLLGLDLGELLTPGPLPVGVGVGCPGIRPGALVRTPLGRCTLNFAFRGSDGSRYIGTAGHCVLGGSAGDATPTRADGGEVVFAPGAGPIAFEGSPGSNGPTRPGRIGEFAYAVADDRSDFALIRLDPGIEANPQVCYFGGPVGLNDGPVPLVSPLAHVGQGRLLSGLVAARTQLALDSDDHGVVGLGLAAPGDSGEPLLSADGQALGVVTATGPALAGLPGTGLVFSTLLAPALDRATDATGIAFTLETAPPS
ncbi:MAG: hypothetical protein ACT4OS_01000 [Acidimicrobiales bacterium]